MKVSVLLYTNIILKFTVFIYTCFSFIILFTNKIVRLIFVY